MCCISMMDLHFQDLVLNLSICESVIVKHISLMTAIFLNDIFSDSFTECVVLARRSALSILPNAHKRSHGLALQ